MYSIAHNFHFVNLKESKKVSVLGFSYTKQKGISQCEIPFRLKTKSLFMKGGFVFLEYRYN